MEKKKIAIACQGGGSQTAFTAGVLSCLLRNKVHGQKEIVALSGTSGGAVCAALAWYGLLRTANGDAEPAERWLERFWQANIARAGMEGWTNDAIVHYLQVVDTGLLPFWKTSPYAPSRRIMEATFRQWMPRFCDLKKLLEDQIDFATLPKLIDPSRSPVLIIGAADVLSGEFKKFNSRKSDIRVEMILASAAVPSISRAVTVDGRAYWDGLFSENPPTDELMDRDAVGPQRLPDQIWIIQINPKGRETIPRTVEEIVDRRNEMIGNQSLYHDLNRICLYNKLMEQKAFKPEYEEKHRLKPVEIYTICISPEAGAPLDYASKLDRSEKLIGGLLEDGNRQCKAFLEDPDSMRYEEKDH